MLRVITFADVGKVAGAAPGHADVEELAGEPALGNHSVTGVDGDALGAVCGGCIAQLNARLEVRPGEYDPRSRFPPNR